MNACDYFTLPLISILILPFITVCSYQSNCYDPDSGIIVQIDQNYSASVGMQELKLTQCLECWQIYVQIYIAICRRGWGLGLRKSTAFYMDLPAL